MQWRTGPRLTILINRILLLVFICPISKNEIAKIIATKNMVAKTIAAINITTKKYRY